MDKQQIKEVMSIARPAIIAMYGRYGSMSLVAYSDLDPSLWIQVDRVYGGTRDSYKLRIQEGRVTHLSEGELKL